MNKYDVIMRFECSLSGRNGLMMVILSFILTFCRLNDSWAWQRNDQLIFILIVNCDCYRSQLKVQVWLPCSEKLWELDAYVEDHYLIISNTQEQDKHYGDKTQRASYLLLCLCVCVLVHGYHSNLLPGRISSLKGRWAPSLWQGLRQYVNTW